jgi:chemotaxis protein MotB
VVGRAAQDPLLPDDPENARNRRISIVLLNQDHEAEALERAAEARGGSGGDDSLQTGPSIVEDEPDAG